MLNHSTAASVYPRIPVAFCCFKWVAWSAFQIHMNTKYEQSQGHFIGLYGGQIQRETSKSQTWQDGVNITPGK